VLWEAGVVIELPAGVWLAYPSSLFTHFNVHPGNIEGEYWLFPITVLGLSHVTQST
jgi:hypothetical protein